MPNNLKFQEGQVPIDNNLRPVKVDDIPSALELSTDKVRVKVLEIIDELETLRVGSIVTEGDAINFYRQLAHLATFENNTIKFHSGAADVFELMTSLSKLIIRDILDTDDYFQIDVGTHGATTISTVDDGAEASDLTLDIDGDIILDSHTGEFIAKKAGTEFSAANSAYAGMILGYTKIQNDGILSADNSIIIGTSMTVLQTNHTTDVSIAFVAPPSGNVEIEFKAYVAGSSKTVEFALSDNSTFNEINESYTYDNGAYFMDETDRNIVTIPFVVTGLTAGNSYTYYIGADSSSASSYIYHGRFRSTGRHYPPILVKATALPATITTGE
tara:strand:- start:84 stop:1070 length:987 start_codon:yes stop_codon:yes gene_type:complete